MVSKRGRPKQTIIDVTVNYKIQLASIIINSDEYFLDPTNLNVYNLNKDFLGVLKKNKIDNSKQQRL